MRDPRRCIEVMRTIQSHWENTCPDWRFMQLMSNFMSWLGYDPFYMEDDQFVEKFEEFINTI